MTSELSKMSEKNRVAYIPLREEGLTEAAALLGATADMMKQRAHRERTTHKRPCRRGLDGLKP